MNQLLSIALDGIIDHLKLDGLNAYRQLDKAYIGIGQASVVGEFNIHNSHKNHQSETGQLHIVDLWLGISVQDNTPPLFFDSATGVGITAEHAALQAGLNWLHGVLPPILPLLGYDGGHFEIMGTGSQLDFNDWDLYCGPLQLTGNDIDHFADIIWKNHPLKRLEEIILSRFTDRQLHWLKIYRVKDTNINQDVANCFLDSRNDIEAENELYEWPWPFESGRQSLRQFIVMVPRTPPDK